MGEAATAGFSSLTATSSAAVGALGATDLFLPNDGLEKRSEKKRKN